MLNHSFQPNCFFHWRFRDRMLEVMINAGQQIKKGEEVLFYIFFLDFGFEPFPTLVMYLYDGIPT